MCWKLTIAVLVLSSLTGAGCTSLKPQITADAIDFNRAVERTNNEVTLLNIVRSYKRFPRHYTSISDIKGNFTVKASSAASAALGAGRTATTTLVESASGLETTTSRLSTQDSITPSIGAEYTTNPNYTIAVLESQEFYQGVMSPIPLSTLILFRQQGWRDDLLIHLLFENIYFTIKEGDKRAVYEIENDSREVGWRELVNLFRLRLSSNASTEQVHLVTSELTSTGLAKLIEQKLSVRRCKKVEPKVKCDPASDYIVFTKTNESIGIELYRQGALTDAARNYIANSWRSGDRKLLAKYLQSCAGPEFSSFFNLSTDSVRVADSIKGKEICKPELRVGTRSADGVVYYIGEYLRRVYEGSTKHIYINSAPLFTLERSGEASVSTVFEGDTYLVPNGDASGRSMQVITLIQQVINLNKKSEDLPKAQLIQIQ